MQLRLRVRETATERCNYLNIHDRYDVNPSAAGETVSNLWLHTFPEFQRPLGPLKAPQKQLGYRYTREFEQARVWVNTEFGNGRIE